MIKHRSLVLVRHGESEWNKEKRFTGWTDINLSQKGCMEAKKAGLMLKNKNYKFDYAYTSMLKRAIHTLLIILKEINQDWISIKKSWRLNERHYGVLQGLKKNESYKIYGKDQVKKWKENYFKLPPKVLLNDQRFPGNDFRYSNIDKKYLPCSESLELTFKRILPIWENSIFPKIKMKKKVIISAHGNSIRAIFKIFNKINEKKITELKIPNGIPIVYEFNDNLELLDYFYLE